MIANPTRQFSREDGLFLISAAVLIAVITFFLIALGVDTAIAKQARTELQQRLDLHCRLAANQLPITRNVTTQLLHSLGNFVNTLPEEIDWATPFEPWNGDRVRLIVPTNGADPDSFHPIGSAFQANLPSGFQVTADEQIVNDYPLGYWGAPRHAGSRISCEMSIRTRSFLSATPTVRARSSWRLVPRRAPGVAILLAPQFVTVGTPATRFRFLPQTNYAELNPLSAAAPVTGATPFFHDNLVNVFIRGYANPNGDWTPSNLTEQLLACSSPPGAARALLLAGILGRLARWAETRTKTLFLLVQPGDDPMLHRHIEITSYGEDLAARIQQLPHIKFTAGGVSVEASPGTPPLPRRIAEQVRSCFRVYQGGQYGVNLQIPSENLEVDLQNGLSYEAPALTPQSAVAPPYNQLQPWGSTTSSGSEIAISAEEFAMMPFSIQNNPSGQFDGSGDVHRNGGLWPKEGPESPLLRPDLLGALESFRTRLSPGGDLEGADIGQILLITHHAPEEPEVSAIRDIVLNDPVIATLAITALHLPTTAAELAQPALSRLQRAFTPLPGLPEPLPYNPQTYVGENLVLSFTPNPFGGNTDVELKALWHDMLDAANPRSAAASAKSIFSFRLAKLRVDL